MKKTGKLKSLAAVLIAVSLLAGCGARSVSQWLDVQASQAAAAAQSALPSEALPSSAGEPSLPLAASAEQAVEMPVETYFPRAGQAPKPVLTDIIGKARSTLDVAIYSFTDTDIGDALIAAERRGVEVRVISDRECSSNKYQKKLLKSLKANGIPVKIDTHTGLMHLKVTIADRLVVTTGSFNYTKAAENSNDEVFVVLRSAQAGQRFEQEFSSMWNNSGDFTQF